MDFFSQRGITVFGISLDSVESHLEFSESVAPDVTLLSDSDGSVSSSYGIDPGQLERGYFVIDKNRAIAYQYIVVGSVLANQTGTLLMEIDIMTGNYTGNPDDYTSGGVLVSHEDDGNDVGHHAYDFGLQAQCGATLTLYDQLKLQDNGIMIVFFRRPGTRDARVMFSEFMTDLESFNSRGVGILGISDSPPEDLMAFADDLGVEGREITFLYDRKGETGKQYGVYKGLGLGNLGRHKTAYFFIDADGVIQYKHTGSKLDNQNLLDEIDTLIEP